jgi:hypothetical protein
MFVGYDDIQDKIREDRHKHEEKLDKAPKRSNWPRQKPNSTRKKWSGCAAR